jgi:hypothetical protein
MTNNRSMTINFEEATPLAQATTMLQEHIIPALKEFATVGILYSANEQQQQDVLQARQMATRCDLACINGGNQAAVLAALYQLVKKDRDIKIHIKVICLVTMRRDTNSQIAIPTPAAIVQSTQELSDCLQDPNTCVLIWKNQTSDNQPAIGGGITRHTGQATSRELSTIAEDYKVIIRRHEATQNQPPDPHEQCKLCVIL